MLETLIDNLKLKTKKQVKVRLNQNKSHYFVLKDSKKLISLSLHNFFSKAPDIVINAIVNFIIYKKKQDFIPIRRFIYQSQIKLDFSAHLDKNKLIAKGEYFDLNKELNEVNLNYFEGIYDLNITWFSSRYKTYRNITFGSYDRACKLIRINKLLDQKKVSKEYMQYLIFHEILHEVFPSKILKSGRCQMHSKEFKAYERTFPNFNEMKKFEKYFMKNLWR